MYGADGYTTTISQSLDNIKHFSSVDDYILNLPKIIGDTRHPGIWEYFHNYSNNGALQLYHTPGTMNSTQANYQIAKYP